MAPTSHEIPSESVPLPAGPVGLLADSHGSEGITARATRLLIEAGAASLIHLGDICDVDVLAAMAEQTQSAGHAVPVRLVFGNMDEGIEQELRRAAASYDFGVDHPVGRYTVGGKILIAHHGHFRGLEEAAASAGASHYLHGHTHKQRDERRDGLRIVNPGALHRASAYTVALLEPLSDALETMTVTRDS